jgi:hypothetical protein
MFSTDPYKPPSTSVQTMEIPLYQFLTEMRDDLKHDQTVFKVELKNDQDKMEARLKTFQKENNNYLLMQLMRIVLGGGTVAFGIAMAGFTWFGFQVNHPLWRPQST